MMDGGDARRVRTAFAEFPTLETERLLLREITRDDAQDWFRVWGDDRVAGQTDVDTFTGVAQAEDLIRWWAGRFETGQGLRWAITTKSEQALLGSCGFHCFDIAAGRAEIGYELAPEFWRQGIVSEAITRLVEFGFTVMGLHRIEALVNMDNVASAGLLTTVGFQEEGPRRAYAYFRGAYHDQRCFALLQTDARPEQKKSGRVPL